jgi:hypothetical protein
MIVLQILIPFLLWLGLAWFASNGFKHMEEFWYFIVLPFALIAILAVLMGVILFLNWVY